MHVLRMLLILPLCWATAQEPAELEVRSAIEKFFEGFHAKNAATIQTTVGEGIILQTIAVNKEGDTVVRSESYEEFIAAITGIPDSVDFKELIHDYRIRIDGPMAHVWTPYEFWVNEQFSHCGVNSFQLVKQGGKWKIIYLIDTRRKENCP